MYSRKCCLMRYARSAVVFFVCLFALYVGSANAAQPNSKNENLPSKSNKQNAKAPFTVKLLDGLYLFQGWYDGIPVSEASIGPHSGEGVYPLFVVEKGKLRDPYALASRVGIQTFFKKYIRGNVFETYVGGRSVGKLNGYQLQTCEFLLDKTWAPMMTGGGNFEGSHLSTTVKMEKPKAPREMWEYRPYPAPKAVFTPGKLLRQAPELHSNLTEEDLQRLYLLFDEQISQTNGDKNKLKRKKTEREFELANIRAMALDVDGNGLKDLLAIYGYYLGSRSVPHDARKYQTQAFIIMDSRKLEPITSGMHGGLMPGGLIDIDQDDVQEIIFIEEFESIHEPGPTGGRFSIFHREPKGWRKVYQTSRFNLDCLEDHTHVYK